MLVFLEEKLKAPIRDFSLIWKFSDQKRLDILIFQK